MSFFRNKKKKTIFFFNTQFLIAKYDTAEYNPVEYEQIEFEESFAKK